VEDLPDILASDHPGDTFGVRGGARVSGLHVTVCHLPPGTSKWNKSNTGCSPRSP
jgi:hypothetical protein